MRLRSTFALFAVLVLTLTAPAARAATGFVASLSGTNEVPPNASTATGSGTFILNDAQTQLSYNITHNVVNESNAHIHGPAGPGVNAGVVFPLGVGSPKIGVWAIDAVNLARLLAGQLYVNVHSTAIPGGEIRGQIVLEVTPSRPSTWGRIKSLYR